MLCRASGCAALLAVLATCNGPMRSAAPVATVAPRIPPAPPPHVFDPDAVRPDPNDPVQRALVQLRAGDAAQAAAIASTPSPDPAASARATWVRASALAAAGDAAAAAEALREIASGDGPLAPWAALERARALLQTDPATAAAELAPLLELEGWPGHAEALELRALALARAGDPEAEARLRELLAQAPPESARASISAPLAELLAARDDEDARVEAIGLWRRIMVRAPTSNAARDAEAHVTATLPLLHRVTRRRLTELSIEDSLARADAFEAGMHHTEAEQEYASAAERTEDDALRCRALFGRGKALYNGRERERAAPLLAEVARDCTDPEIRGWSRFYSGRAYASAHEIDRALAQFSRLEEELPDHRLADDARFRAALLDVERGDETAMSQRLNELVQRYPQGDMHGEARFLMAWRARAAGRFDDALAQLDANLAEGTLETAEDLRGRTSYWRACVLAESGQTEQARQEWLALARDLPLAYYGQQAVARLSEQSAADAELARESLGARADGRIAFEWRDAFDSPGFARALELLRVGEVERAQRELDAVLGDDEDARWIDAALLDRVGAHSRSVSLTRRLRSFMDRPPSGEHFARWRIAYPHAYSPLIDDVASERSLPPELIRAIAREESSFRADAVSVANAYGLIQLIVPTARRYARPLGLAATPETLIQPDTNVRVGSAFIAFLWDRYRDNPAVLPSAYNAGQGATDRWLRERPQQRLDAWVEDIPYDETRRYTRRVLQSWGIYAWLDRGEVSLLAPQLPASVEE